ncbi:MAG: epoxyqueuosine reductase [bacterium]
MEKFSEAPNGFHPKDIFPDTKSVIVIAKRLPNGIFYTKDPVPYTSASSVILHEVIRISCELCIELERNNGFIAVPIPSEPYEYWDEDKKEGKGILSLKHAGYLAGLGSLGKNTLFVNREYGNRLILGAVLLNSALVDDQVYDYRFCHDACTLCIDS